MSDPRFADLRPVRLLRDIDRLPDHADHRELVGDQIPAESWDRFVVDFRSHPVRPGVRPVLSLRRKCSTTRSPGCAASGTWSGGPQTPGNGSPQPFGAGDRTRKSGPLKHMGEHYKLVIFSDADDSFLKESVPRLGVEFHAVFTAEQAGYYKPRYAAFEYMFAQLDAAPDDFVHVSRTPATTCMPVHDLGFRDLVLLDRAMTRPRRRTRPCARRSWTSSTRRSGSDQTRMRHRSPQESPGHRSSHSKNGLNVVAGAQPFALRPPGRDIRPGHRRRPPRRPRPARGCGDGVHQD